MNNVYKVLRPTEPNIPNPHVLLQLPATGRDFLMPFDDELQKMFAVQGNPPYIFAEVSIDYSNGKFYRKVIRVVTQERWR